MAACMQGCDYDNFGWQHYIKVKTLWTQWVCVMDHNWWSGVAGAGLHPGSQGPKPGATYLFKHRRDAGLVPALMRTHWRRAPQARSCSNWSTSHHWPCLSVWASQTGTCPGNPQCTPTMRRTGQGWPHPWPDTAPSWRGPLHMWPSLQSSIPCRQLDHATTARLRVQAPGPPAMSVP